MIRWIKRALGYAKYRRGLKEREEPRHAGALHRQLGVPEGSIIPKRLLRQAAKEPGKLGKRARLALTLRRFNKRWQQTKKHFRGRK